MHTTTVPHLGPLERGLHVLEILCEVKKPLGFNELNRRLGGYNKSTLSRMLKVLCELGYVEQTYEQGPYRIGRKIIGFKRASIPAVGEALQHQWQPTLRYIAQAYPVSTILFECSGKTAIGIDKAINEQAPSMQPLNKSNDSQGQSPWCWLLAQSQNLPIVAEADIHQQGWAWDAACYLTHINRLACGIYDRNENLIGIFAMGGFSLSFTAEVRDQILNYLYSTQPFHGVNL